MINRIEQLSINITDICNMECEFCLRGDGEGRKLNLSLIPQIFDGLDIIDEITITGGEPGCYVEAVTAITDYLVEHRDQIDVRGLFIITNAKEYRQELVDAVKRMLFLHMEKEYGTGKMISGRDVHVCNYALEEMLHSFGIAVSMDQFHEPVNIMNYFRYRTSGVYSRSKEIDYKDGGIMARGRGAGLYRSMDRPYYEFSVQTDQEEIMAYQVYVTVEGQVFADCDMSYEMETYNEPAGDLYEETLAQIMQRHADENNDIQNMDY